MGMVIDKNGAFRKVVQSRVAQGRKVGNEIKKNLKPSMRKR